MVLVNGYDEKMRISSVSPDYLMGAILATKELINHGHKKIKLITSGKRQSFFDRKAGFIRALEIENIPIPKNAILDLELYSEKKLGWDTPNIQRGGGSGITFRANKILPHAYENGEFDEFTAAFCACDRTAIHLIDLLKSKGYSIPDDFSIIGFDDLEISAMTTPPLSTMKVDFDALTEAALDLLITKLINTNHSMRLSTPVLPKFRETVKEICVQL